jgi:hypothetical protein
LLALNILPAYKTGDKGFISLLSALNIGARSPLDITALFALNISDLSDLNIPELLLALDILALPSTLRGYSCNLHCGYYLSFKKRFGCTDTNGNKKLLFLTVLVEKGDGIFCPD